MTIFTFPDTFGDSGSVVASATAIPVVATTSQNTASGSAKEVRTATATPTTLSTNPKQSEATATSTPTATVADAVVSVSPTSVDATSSATGVGMSLLTTPISSMVETAVESSTGNIRVSTTTSSPGVGVGITSTATPVVATLTPTTALGEKAIVSSVGPLASSLSPIQPSTTTGTTSSATPVVADVSPTIGHLPVSESVSATPLRATLSPNLALEQSTRDGISTHSTDDWKSRTATSGGVTFRDDTIELRKSTDRVFNGDSTDNGDSVLASGNFYPQSEGYSHNQSEYIHDNSPFQDGDVREYTFSGDGSDGSLRIGARNSERSVADGTGPDTTTFDSELPFSATYDVEYTNGEFIVRDSSGSTLRTLSGYSGEMYISFEEGFNSTESSIILTGVDNRSLNKDPTDNGDNILSDGVWNTAPGGYAHDRNYTHDNVPFEDGDVRDYTFSSMQSDANINFSPRNSVQEVSDDNPGYTDQIISSPHPDVFTIEVEYTNGEFIFRDESGATLYTENGFSGPMYASFYMFGGTSGYTSMRLTDIVAKYPGTPQWTSELWSPKRDEIAEIQTFRASTIGGDSGVNVRVSGYDETGSPISGEDTGFIPIGDVSNAEGLSARQFQIEFSLDVDVTNETTIDSYVLTAGDDGVVDLLRATAHRISTTQSQPVSDSTVGVSTPTPTAMEATTQNPSTTATASPSAAPATLSATSAGGGAIGAASTATPAPSTRAVSHPTSTVPTVESQAVSTVEDTPASTLATHIPTSNGGSSVTALPVDVGTETAVTVGNATAVPSVAHTPIVTTPMKPSTTGFSTVGSVHTQTTTHPTTPSATSHTSLIVKYKPVQTTSHPIAVAQESFTAYATPVVAHTTGFGARSLIDAARAKPTTMSTTTFSPVIDTNTETGTIMANMATDPRVGYGNVTSSTRGSAVTMTPSVHPATVSSGASVGARMVSVTTTPRYPNADLGKTVGAIPVSETVSPIAPLSNSRTVSHAKHADVGSSTAIPTVTTDVTAESLLHRVVMTPTEPFKYEPRIESPVTSSNQIQAQDMSSSASLRSSRNQSDIDSGSNSSPLNVSTNEIDIDVTE